MRALVTFTIFLFGLLVGAQALAAWTTTGQCNCGGRSWNVGGGSFPTQAVCESERARHPPPMSNGKRCCDVRCVGSNSGSARGGVAHTPDFSALLPKKAPADFTQENAQIDKAKEATSRIVDESRAREFADSQVAKSGPDADSLLYGVPIEGDTPHLLRDEEEGGPIVEKKRERTCDELKTQLASDKEAVRRQTKTDKLAREELDHWKGQKDKAILEALETAADMFMGKFAKKLEARAKKANRLLEKIQSGLKSGKLSPERAAQYKALVAKIQPLTRVREMQQDVSKMGDQMQSAGKNYEKFRKTVDVMAADVRKEDTELGAVAKIFTDEVEIETTDRSAGVVTVKESVKDFLTDEKNIAGTFKSFAMEFPAAKWTQFLIDSGYAGTKFVLARENAALNEKVLDSSRTAMRGLIQQINRTVTDLERQRCDYCHLWDETLIEVSFHKFCGQ